MEQRAASRQTKNVSDGQTMMMTRILHLHSVFYTSTVQRKNTGYRTNAGDVSKDQV